MVNEGDGVENAGNACGSCGVPIVVLAVVVLIVGRLGLLLRVCLGSPKVTY